MVTGSDGRGEGKQANVHQMRDKTNRSQDTDLSGVQGSGSVQTLLIKVISSLVTCVSVGVLAGLTGAIAVTVYRWLM